MPVPVMSDIIGAVLLDGTTGLPASTGGGAVIGATGGITPRVNAASYSRPADATTYAIGDMIGNSLTAASVVPMSFSVARVAGGSGRISAARCVVTAASGTIVLPAFDLLLFRPEANIPFAAAGYPADNAALLISSAAYIQLIGVFSFPLTTWRNARGDAAAFGTVIRQAVTDQNGRPYATFNLASTGGTTLLGILQAQSAWAPGAVVNTFDFGLDVDQD